MAILLFILPFLFASSTQAQYIWAIPCNTTVQCASVLGSSQNYQCTQGYCLCPNFTTQTYELCSNKDMILTAKASGLRRNCTKHEDCDTVKGANCLPKDPKDKSSKICLCKLDMVESEDGQSCLPVVTELGGKCLEKAQCISRLEEGAVCLDGQCRCRNSHHFKGSKCVRNLGYGDHCKPEEDGCYEVNAPDGENLLKCTEAYGCRCKRHWTYNQRNQHCEFSGASQVVVPFATMLLSILIIVSF